MGQSQSSETQKFLESFKNQFQLLKTVNDRKFAEATIYRNKNDQQMILLKTYWSKNEEDHKNGLSQCQMLSQLNHKNVLKLLGYHQNAQNHICGDFTKVSIYFEYFDNTLEKEIENRQEKQKYFTEQELWLILYEIISGLSYLESKKRLHGDIRPQNFQMTNDGHLKVIEIGTLAGESSAFLKTYFNKEKTYLAPELIPLVQSNQFTNQPPPGLTTQKSDIFSVGITLLECSTLYSGKQLYKFDENSYKLDYSSLDQLQQNIQNIGYSHFWFRVVRELLQEKPEDRPTFHDVLEVLKPYEDSITKKISFQFTSPENSHRSQNGTQLQSEQLLIQAQQQSSQQQQLQQMPQQSLIQQPQQQPSQIYLQQSNQQQSQIGGQYQQLNNTNQFVSAWQAQQPVILQQQAVSPYLEQQYISVNNSEFQDQQLNAYQSANLQPVIIQMQTPPPQILDQQIVQQQPYYYTQNTDPYYGQKQQYELEYSNRMEPLQYQITEQRPKYY